MLRGFLHSLLCYATGFGLFWFLIIRTGDEVWDHALHDVSCFVDDGDDAGVDGHGFALSGGVPADGGATVATFRHLWASPFRLTLRSSRRNVRRVCWCVGGR